MGKSLLALPSEVRIAVSAARRLASKLGIELVVTSTFRTRSEQAFLFNQFRRGLTSFPVAPPGTSRHEFGLAVDAVALPPSGLPLLVQAMQAVGFRWAGPSDSVHFDFLLPVGRPEPLVKRTLGAIARAFPPSRVSPIPKTGAARPLSACCCL